MPSHSAPRGRRSASAPRGRRNGGTLGRRVALVAVALLVVGAGAAGAYVGLPSLRALQERRVFPAATATATGGPAPSVKPLVPETAEPASYPGQRYPAALPAPSGDKPQSKVWRAGDTWWAVMVSVKKKVPTVHELRADHTWRDTGTVVDSRADSTADVLFEKDALYVVSRTETGSITYSRFAYTPGKRTYARAQGFPVTVATGGTESASLAKDSTGTVWATYTQGARVWFARSAGTDDTTWSKALLRVPDNTVGADDVSAIVAFKGKVGIAWSDQGNWAFRFAVHADGAAPGAWKVETPLSGDGMVDDHINLKAVAGDGRVFAAVKTSQDLVGGGDDAPGMYVLRRDPDGTWEKTVVGLVGDRLTRPQLLLDRESSRVYLFEAAPTTGGSIYYKSSPFGPLSFATGRGAPFVTGPAGAAINDVSTAKGSTTSAVDAVVIAVDTNGHRYYHGELPVTADDIAKPVLPSQITSAATPEGAVRTTWKAATDDRGIVAYDVYMNGIVVETIDVTTANRTAVDWTWTTPTLTPGTYQLAVEARDEAGNVSPRRTAPQVVIQ
jgi:hypothetical protein